MSDTQLHGILRQLRRIVGPSPAGGLTDAQLLDRVVAGSDPAAFEVLVWRHGPMVYGICRRILRNEHDTEDAFQATFLTFGRKAGSLARGESLAGWLYTVAYRVALRARADAVKRSARERLDATPPETPVDAAAEESLFRGELQAVVDEELLRLPVKYRTPLILCDLQGKSHAEAAQEIGRPAGSMSRYLAQARDLLRRRLTRRGVTLTSSFLASALAREAGAATIPSLLVGPTVEAGLQFGRGRVVGDVVSPQAVALAEGVLRAMVVSKVKSVAAVLLVGLVAAGAGLVACEGFLARPLQAQEGKPEPAKGDPPPKEAAANAPVAELPNDPLPSGASRRLGTMRLRHGARVSSTAYSPDGKTIASASADRSVRLWDAATGKLLHRLQGNDRPVLALAFSPDGKTVAAAGARDNIIRIWEVATGMELGRIESMMGMVRSLAFTPDGKVLASAGDDDTIRLWDPAVCAPVHRWTAGHSPRDAAVGPNTGVLAIAITPDGKALVSGGGDGTLRVWDAATGKQLHKLATNQDLVSSVAIAPDGKTMAAAGTKHVLLFDLATGKEGRKLEGNKASLQSVAFTADGKMVVAGTEQGTVCIWEAGTGKLLHQLEGHHAAVGAIATAPDGKGIVTGSDDNTMRVWDATTGKEAILLGGHQGIAHTASFSADGRFIATTGIDHMVRLWDAATGKEIRVLKGHPGDVKAAVFAPDGKTVYSAGTDGTVRVWETATGKEVRQFQGSAGKVSTLALAPDGGVLMTASTDQGLKQWDVATGAIVRNFGGEKAHIVRVAYAPDGKSVASAGADNTIRLWDVASGKEVRQIGEKHGWPLCVTFSPDGRLLATGKGDGLIRLWDVATGKEARELKGHTAWVSALAFSPDGKTLASSDYIGAVRLWEVATGRERYRSPGHRAAVWNLAFAPDGRALASVSSDSTALLWDMTAQAAVPPLAKPELADEQLNLLWRNLTGDDAAQGYLALGTLVQAPKQAIPLAQKQLTRAAAANSERIAKLIRELDDDNFDVRENASTELAKLGDLAELALRKALEGNPTAEVRRRIGMLLEKMQGQAPSASRLEALRGTELLERLGTPEARQVLGELAKGPPEAATTREAKMALERLPMK